MLRGRMFFDGLLHTWTPISNLRFHVFHIAVEESQHIGSSQVEGRVWSPSGMLNMKFEKAIRQWLIGADDVSGCCMLMHETKTPYSLHEMQCRKKGSRV